MTTLIKLSLSDALAEQIDRERGVLSRQDYITQLLVCGRADLLDEIARLHTTIRALAGGPPATPDASRATMLSFD